MTRGWRVCTCIFTRWDVVQRCPSACSPAGSNTQRPVETCSHRRVMDPHQQGATGQTGPEGAGGVYYRKNTFLLLFCASATPASGKLKELQLDIWEVLMLSSHPGSWDVCGRWSKNDCKSQWIQQKWPQSPPAPSLPLQGYSLHHGAINRRMKSRPVQWLWWLSHRNRRFLVTETCTCTVNAT